jgi:Mycobacterium 19 kDa lipoprotein antigen
MRKEIGAAVSAAIMVAGLVGCSSNASSSVGTPGNPGIPKATVNGQWQTIQGPAVCKTIRGGPGYEVSIATDKASQDIGVELAKDASAVWFVRISHFEGNKELHWLEHVTTPGHASAVKNGNSYKVTGEIAPAYGRSTRTYPFEIDFSCA